jgi:hypothetical protein
MIFVKRPDTPQVLKVHPRFKQFNRDYMREFKKGEFSREDMRLESKRLETMLPTGIRGFLLALENIFNHKCAYCESKLEAGYLSLFRPSKGASGSNSAPLLTENWSEYYFWLVWNWPNHYFSCLDCSDSKGFYFPVAKTRAIPGIFSSFRLLEEEKPYIVDPCYENPLQFLQFSPDGTVVPREGSERGQKTIDVFGLNRQALITARKKEFGIFKNELGALLATCRDANIEELTNTYETRLLITKRSLE